jgi:hypothetical protein
MDHATLKQQQRLQRGSLPEGLNLRVHRALSWLKRAELLHDDPDGRFIFLWIAFNAAYATEVDDRYRLPEQQTYQAFLQKLVDLDAGGRIGQLVWKEFPGSFRLLIDNRFVFQDFWHYKNGRLDEDTWKHRFAAARKSAHDALGQMDTVAVLSVVLSRLYTLRNQLMHGGATWNGSVNRDQIRDGVNLLGKLVPIVIATMLDHPEAPWGDPCYPVVEGAD